MSPESSHSKRCPIYAAISPWGCIPIITKTARAPSQNAKNVVTTTLEIMGNYSGRYAAYQHRVCFISGFLI